MSIHGENQAISLVCLNLSVRGPWSWEVLLTPGGAPIYKPMAFALLIWTRDPMVTSVVFSH